MFLFALASRKLRDPIGGFVSPATAAEALTEVGRDEPEWVRVLKDYALRFAAEPAVPANIIRRWSRRSAQIPCNASRGHVPASDGGTEGSPSVTVATTAVWPCRSSSGA